MKKWFKKTLYLLAVIFLILIAINLNLILYGIGQLKGQLYIINNSKPIIEVISDPATPDSIVVKLRLIEEIRRFAIDSLGLMDSDNYTTYFDQQNRPLMFVVTGCLPYQLKAKQWWFPIVGSVAYKGFFSESKAKEEEQTIRTQGYETDIYSPSAWSTLGYFTDPILSNMLKRSNGRLAELIIHELTHATIYLESSVDFNENFATFVGEQGAREFLEFKYGTNSDELNRYNDFLEDQNLYGSYMLRASEQLDSLYGTFTEDMKTEQKARLKYNKISNIMLNLNKLPFRNPKPFKFDFENKPLPNNTEFMAFLRYRKNLSHFENIFKEQYSGDLQFFIDQVTEDPDLLSEHP